MPQDYRSAYRSTGSADIAVIGSVVTNHNANVVGYVLGAGFVAAHDKEKILMLSADGNAWGPVWTDRVMGEIPFFQSGVDLWGVDTQVVGYEKLMSQNATTYPQFNAKQLGVTDLTDTTNCWASSGKEILLLEKFGNITYIPLESDGGTAPAGTPSEPQSLVASPSNQSVALSWAIPASAGTSAITSYVVQQSSDFGATWTQARTTSATSVVISSLTNGTGYLFRVAAVNASGTGVFSVASVLSTPAPSPSAAPTNVTAAVSGRFSFNGLAMGFALSWSAPSDNGGAAITGYRIEYGVSELANVRPYLAGTTSTPATSTTVGMTNSGYVFSNTLPKSLSNGMSYSFRVSAVTAAGVGTPSAPTPLTVLR